MKLVLTLFLHLTATSFCRANSDHDAGHSSANPGLYNFDVTSMDFMNTQTRKLCLLARLNVSIELAYKTNASRRQLFIPHYATTDGSYCDQNFTSLLHLNFDGLAFRMIFKRDTVERSETAPVYCNKCDTGHWRLDSLELYSDDLSHVMDDVPSTLLLAKVNATDLSMNAGGIAAQISLQRGYRCNDKILAANLKVVDAYDRSLSAHSMGSWAVNVEIISIETQPFLVTNKKVKDPLLCKDVTVSIVLIITIPIIYFVFFILIYRLKDQRTFQRLGIRCFSSDSDAKVLLYASTSDVTKPFISPGKRHPVSVTCTRPDQSEVKLM